MYLVVILTYIIFNKYCSNADKANKLQTWKYDENNIIRHTCDAKVWQSHRAFFDDDKRNLGISIYFDEIEVFRYKVSKSKYVKKKLL